MVGVARRLEYGEKIENLQQFQKQYDLLLSSPDYLASVETGTSQEANVETRMMLAKNAFADVK